jgi:biotin transporter BioY
MVARVFWIMLGLWAEAKPAAITQTRIVTVGFIVSPYFFAGGTGLLAGPAGSRS